MSTPVSQINITQIEQLQELIAKNPDFYFVCRDTVNGVTYRIKGSALTGGESVQANWISTFDYNAGQVVQANGKWWQSLITDGVTENIGNFPTEGTFWTEVSKSVGDGSIAYWAAGVYTANPSIVLEGTSLYLLKSSVTLPYNSTTAPSVTPTHWDMITGGAGSVASNADMDAGTNDTKFVSPLKFVYGITTRVFSDLATTAKTILGSIAELLGLIKIKQPVFTGICESCPIYSTDIIRDAATRTLTIATIKGGQTISASNPIRFYTYSNGVKTLWEKTTPQSVQWSATTGLKYFYFDIDGVLKSSTSQWTSSTLENIATIWRLYWNGNISTIVRDSIEYHPNTTSAIDRLWKHRYGAVWLSGFELVYNAITSGAPSSTGLNTCVSMTGGTAIDDNLPYTVTNSTVSADFSQDLGNETAASITSSNAGIFDVTYNDGSGILSILAGTRFPFAYNVATNIPQTISASGVFTDVQSNYFFNYYLYSFQDPRYGKVISLRSGGQYSSQSLADAETWEAIKAASPTLQDGEVRQLWKLTFEYKTAYDVGCKKSALRSIVNLRSNAAISISSGSGSGASIASNVSVTPPTGYTSTDMQGLSNEFGADIQAIESSTIPTVVSGEKVVTRTPTSVNVDKDIIEMQIAAGTIASANWTTGQATYTGTQGQTTYDSNYKYECIGTNLWIRTMLVEGRLELYLSPDVDDSGGAKTSAQLDAAYPSAQIGQKVWGTTLYVYEKKATNLWRKISFTTA